MREHYPILANCLYFNTAYTAPLSLELVQWQQEDDAAYLNQGDHYKLHIEKRYLDEARTALATFAGADKATTFITGNFSSAFQNFLMHIPRDYSILLLEDEYPSLTGIVEDMGFNSTVLPLSSTIETQLWEHLQEHSYAVFALSAIQYTSGLYFDRAWLTKIKKAFPEMLLLVDGTQFLGAELFSFNQSPFDAIFGSTYKWLLAGYGTGYAIIKPDLLKQLGLSPKKIAASYDRGQVSVKAVGSLNFSLNQIMQADFPSLIKHKKQLSAKLFTALKQRKLLSSSIAERAEHSSIFNLQLREETYQALLANGVRCIKRGNGVRIAVHYYNTTEDVEALLSLLDELL